MITHRHTFAFQGGDAINSPVEISAGAEHNLDELIPGGSTDLSVAFALVIAKLAALYIVADRPMTIKTNSSGSPVNTITLTAGVPFVWNNTMAAMRDTAGVVVSTNITSLFVTLAAGNDSIVHLRALVDPT